MDFEAKFMSAYGLVSLVDAIMYEAKASEHRNKPLFLSLKKHLSNFIEENNLDTDIHEFATLPDDFEGDY